MTPPAASVSPSAPTSSSPQKTGKGQIGWGGMVMMIVLPIAIAGVVFSSFFWSDYQQNKIKKTGVAATASVIDIAPTGNTYNSQPQVLLTLRVKPMQGEEFTAQTKMVINPVYIPRFQPGATLKVFFDPNDHSRVAVD